MDLSTGAFASDIHNALINIGIILGGAWIGWKKLVKHSNKEDLDATKAKAEKNVIDMIYDRLSELEKVNRDLTAELEATRKEIMVSRHQNEAMRKEIMQLKRFIELNFSPTYDKPSN